MPSIAEFQIGLAVSLDTSAANAAARTFSQTLLEMKTNMGVLLQTFPQLATSSGAVATEMQVVSQAAQQSTQSITQLDGAVTQNKTQMDQMSQSLTAIGTPLNNLSQSTNEYQGVLTSTGQKMNQFEATSSTMESTLQQSNNTMQQGKEAVSGYNSAVGQLEPSMRQLDSGVTEVTGGLNQNNTIVKAETQSFTELNGALTGMNPAFQKQIQANKDTNQAQTQTRASALALGTQFLALGTLAFGVYNSFIQLEKSHLAVEKAQLGVDRAARVLLASEQALDNLILKNKIDTVAVTQARNDLRIATEALNESIKAGILTGQEFENQQTAVSDALANLAVQLKEAGVETDSVDLAVQKYANSLKSDLLKNQQLAIAKTNEFREQLGLVLNVAGVVATAVGSVATILDTFKLTANASAVSSFVAAGAMRVLTIAADTLKISVRSLLISTGVGVGLVALGFILEALLPKAEAASGGLDDMGNSAIDAGGSVATMDQSMVSATENANKLESAADILDATIARLGGTADTAAPKLEDLLKGAGKALQNVQLPPSVPGAPTGGTSATPIPLQNDPRGPTRPASEIDTKKALIALNPQLKASEDPVLENAIRGAKIYDQNIQVLKSLYEQKYKDRLITAESVPLIQALENQLIDKTIPSYAEFQKKLGEVAPLIHAQSGALQTVTQITGQMTAEQWRNIEAEAEANNKRQEAIEGNARWVQGLFGANVATQLAGETTSQYALRMSRLAGFAQDAKAKEDAYVDSLIGTAVELKLNVTQQDALGRAMLDGKEGLQTLILSNQTLADVLGDTTRAQDNFRRGQVDGRLATVQFIDDTRKSIGFQQQMRSDLLLTADMFGIKLPLGIDLTIDQLKALIAEYLETGSATKTLQLIHNEAFAEMHKNIDEVVAAAVEGGKKWREAWKDLKEFIPKGQRKDFHDFIEDLADITDKNEALFNTASAFHKLSDAGVKLSKSDLKDWTSKFKVELRDMKDEMNDIYDKDLVNAVFNPLIDLSKQDLSQTGLDLLAAQINNIHEALKDGTNAEELADLARQASELQSILAAPGEKGSPETGVLEDFDENERLLKERGLKGGGGQTALSQQVETLKTATKGAADQIKTDTTAANVAIQSTQTAFANLSEQGSNSMSILVSNIKPHIETLNTYFNETVVTAVGNAAKALLAFQILSDSLMGGGKTGKSNAKFQNVVDFNIPGGNFLGDNEMILPNMPGGSGGNSTGGGGGGNPFDLNKNLQLRTSGGADTGKSSPLLNFFIQVQKAAAQTSQIVQKEFTAMYTALSGIFVGIAEQWSIDMVDMADFAVITNTTVQEEFGKMFTALKAIFLEMDKVWSEDLVDMADFAVITSEDIQNEWAKMENASEKIFQALTASWKKEVNTWIRLAADAAHDINAQLATIKDKTVTITCKQSGNCSCGKAEGGFLGMSFAEGGNISAAEGLQFVTSGRQQYTIGDNNSAREAIWAIPEDRPNRVVKQINQAYGFGEGNGGSFTNVNLNANINVYTQDGQFLGVARVRKRFTFSNLEAH